MSSPRNIKEWFNAQAVVNPPTPELTLETPDRLVASIEQVGEVAKTVNKLKAMADRGELQKEIPLTCVSA